MLETILHPGHVALLCAKAVAWRGICAENADFWDHFAKNGKLWKRGILLLLFMRDFMRF